MVDEKCFLNGKWNYCNLTKFKSDLDNRNQWNGNQYRFGVN